MRRFLITLAIVLGIAILFFAGSGVLLMLAPGTSLFGVSYVSASVGKNVIKEEWHDYLDGDVYIKTDYIPVNIVFEPYTATKVEFSQFYNGFTTSEERVPNALIERTASSLNIETQEVKKLLVGFNNNFSLTVVLPLVWGESGTHSIFIEGNNSPVTITTRGEGVDATDVLRFNSLKLNCNKEVTFNCNFNVINLEICSNRKVELTENLVAENIKYITNSGTLTVDYAVSGNLNFSSNSGNLKFKEVNNLTAQTRSGSILPNGDSCTVYGVCDITTRSGAIKINNILSSSIEAKLQTNGGQIKIGTLVFGNVSSPYGKISIGKVGSAEIYGKTKPIEISEVSTHLIVASKQGAVKVGFVGGQAVHNVSISTSTGRIEVYNSTGKVDLNSTNGAVTLVNLNSSDININAGKKLTATGLMGKVSLIGQREIVAGFANLTNDVSILGGKATGKITVSIPKTKNELVYNFYNNSNKGIVNLYEGNELTQSENQIKSADGSLHKVTVGANNANINVYLNK